MFSNELHVGYQVAIPRRGGMNGTRPLPAGWYRRTYAQMTNATGRQLSERNPCQEYPPRARPVRPRASQRLVRSGELPKTSETNRNETVIPLLAHQPTNFQHQHQHLTFSLNPTN